MFIAIEAAHANKLQRTGVENVCFALIQELKKQIPLDARVILYSNESLRGEYCHSSDIRRGNPGVLDNLPPNWEAKILRWPFRKLWSQIRLSWEFLRHPPDVFFAPGQLIPFFCPAKTVVIIHDSAFLAYPEAYNFLGRQYLKWMNKRIIKKAWKIITSSEFNKAEIKKYYGEAAGDKVAVIPFAYDSERFRILNIEILNIKRILEKYSITKPFIMSIGRLEKKKNTINIIRAFNIIKSLNNNIQYSIFNIQLLLIGNPGVGYDEIEAEIQKSQYKNDIIHPGWVDSEDISHLLNQASVFVFPSLYEGFGLPVLEAMACGCPVVCSDIPALREVGGEAALYADPASAEDIAAQIGAALNEEKRIEMIKRGLERVKNFSWGKTAAGVLAAME